MATGPMIRTDGLVEEITQAVVENVGLDRHLDNAARKLRQKGKVAVQEHQVQQRANDEELSKELARLVEGERRLREENTRLKEVIHQMTRWLTPHGIPNLDAFIEDATAAEAAAHATWWAANSPPEARPAPTQASAVDPDDTYRIVLRKADGQGLGLNVSHHDGLGLHVLNVEPGGVVEAWNRRCSSDGPTDKVVQKGDTLISVNDANTEQAMLQEISSRWCLRLVFARARKQEASPQKENQASSPPQSSTLRPEAKEWVPSKTLAAAAKSSASKSGRREPLQPRTLRQHSSLPAILEHDEEANVLQSPRSPEKTPSEKSSSSSNNSGEPASWPTVEQSVWLGKENVKVKGRAKQSSTSEEQVLYGPPGLELA